MGLPAGCPGSHGGSVGDEAAVTRAALGFQRTRTRPLGWDTHKRLGEPTVSSERHRVRSPVGRQRRGTAGARGGRGRRGLAQGATKGPRRSGATVAGCGSFEGTEAGLGPAGLWRWWWVGAGCCHPTWSCAHGRPRRRAPRSQARGVTTAASAPAAPPQPPAQPPSACLSRGWLSWPGHPDTLPAMRRDNRFCPHERGSPSSPSLYAQ